MVKAGPVAEFRTVGLLVLATSLGVLWALLAQRFGAPTAMASILLLLTLPLIVPPALVQGARKCRALAKEFTWWHGLWLLLFLSALVFRGRDVPQIREAPLDGWAAYRVALVCAVALVLVARLALRRTGWLASLFRGLPGLLGIYALIALSSTLWSVYPAWTFYKSFEYFVDLALLAAVLATVPFAVSYKGLFDWTWMLLSGLLGTVWLGAMLWPEQAFIQGGEVLPQRISGVLPVLDQNSVGDLAGVLAIVALARLQFPNRGSSGRAFYGVSFAVAFFTLVMSQTRGAMVGFFTGLILVLLLSKRLGMIALLVATAVLLLSLTRAGDLVTGYWQRGERPQELEAYSGRRTLWESAWERIEQRPLIGHGAYAAGRFGVLQAVDDTSSSSLLNSYVETAVGTGLLGMLPVAIAVLGTGWMLVRVAAGGTLGQLEPQLAVEAAGVLGVLVVRSFFTVQFVWHPSLDFLVLLGYAELLRRSR